MDTSNHKRILALDGGGLKGALTLGMLKKVEEILREKHGENYKLAQHFDLIGGTSTGAIIASGLAIGMDVDDLKTKYFNLGEQIFKRGNPLRFLFGGGYFTAKKLQVQLQSVFGDIRLNDPSIQTGLAIFAKRIDTQSLWIIHNNTNHRFWRFQKDYILSECIRASAAAPTYFEAETIDVKNDGNQIGDFVDGGLSTANNPALNLFLLVTIPNYGYAWPTGKEHLSILSFGTGKGTSARLPGGLLKPLGWAQKAPAVLMDDISEQNEILLHLLSHANHPQYFDRVLETLEGVKLINEPLLNFYRYNVDFTTEELNDNLGYDFSNKYIGTLTEMDNPKNIRQLFEIGYAASSKVRPEHLL